MSGKPKFQISRSLDERIKGIIEGSTELGAEFEQVQHAFILGFHYGAVTNYVGLATDYQLNHSVLPVVGLVFIKSSPDAGELEKILDPVKEFAVSPKGFGDFSSDKNRHLYLIYYVDKESNKLEKRMFNTSDGSYLEDESTITILDDAKIYNHSAFTKISVNLKLVLKEGKLSLSGEEVEELFSYSSKDITLSLDHSNYTAKPGAKNESLTESLYSHLDVPAEVLEVGDYQTQLSKKEKAKFVEAAVEKWRNKVKAQRSPLELKLEHDKLSYCLDEPLPGDCYGLNLELYLYLQVNDPLFKTFHVILNLVRKQLEVFRLILSSHSGPLEANEMKSSTFKTHGHLVHTLYPIPSSATPNFDYLEACRKELHRTFLIPLYRPQFRYSQRVANLSMLTPDELAGNLCNVHTTIAANSGVKGGVKTIIEGTYTYHHYMQDRISDNGWGCAYRSLQTIISWFKHQGYIYSPDVKSRGPSEPDKTSPLREKLTKEARVPNHEEIQSVLVDVGDKQPNFIGSQKWIGSQEVCYVLNHLYNLDSKFISVSSGSELVYKARELGLHFGTQSTPVMIGGGVLAHTIIGIDFNEKNGDTSYLILDPHYTGTEDLNTITKKGWCGWKKNTFWDKNAFYNLCLPQRPDEF